jgi:glycosyltransferase involved in cell wall biosynthesis
MSKTIKVLHCTTHDEECGIARYEEQFIRGMRDDKDVKHFIFDVSPNKSRFMSSAEYDQVLEKFRGQLEGCDILHIQHELSFYKHKELDSMIKIAQELSKPVLVTVHTALDIEYKPAALNTVMSDGLREFFARKKLQRNFERVHIDPLRQVDLIIVHNGVTKHSFQKLGFDSQKIIRIRHPVPEISFAKTSKLIKQALSYSKGDVLFCTVGFISRSKGVDQAVKALALLPDNYKLAIIGGLHPYGGDDKYLDGITQFIKAKQLGPRVHITGYIEDDNKMNALIRECDICAYPYDATYYSYVTSGALNAGLANHKPVIAYRTPTFQELNSEEEIIKFCDTPDEHSLAKQLKSIDIKVQSERAKQYAIKYSYKNEARKFAKFYRQLVKVR